VPHQNDVLWYLKIEHNEAGSVSVLTVTGRISSLTAPELERALASAAASPGGLVLDLTGVDYISSPGLRAVASAAAALAERGRPFVVCGMRDAVSVAFALAGLEGRLAIEPSRDDAVARATSPPRAGETAC
jgi:anti-anti-sigma factor